MILSFSCGPLATNSYLVICDKTLKAMVVDLPPESLHTLTQAIEEKGLKVEKIVLTHSHWDHVADLSAFHKIFPVEVCIHQEDAYNIEMPGSDSIPVPFPLAPFTPDTKFQGGETFSVGHLNFEVIHTPGHTPGGICLFEAEKKWLFSGDTLFKGTIGILTIPTGDEDSMWNSLKKLENLPKDTVVYPGHGNTTTIGSEKWLSRAQELFSKH